MPSFISVVKERDFFDKLAMFCAPLAVVFTVARILMPDKILTVVAFISLILFATFSIIALSRHAYLKQRVEHDGETLILKEQDRECDDHGESHV